jgi:hypothetical protein
MCTSEIWTAVGSYFPLNQNSEKPVMRGRGAHYSDGLKTVTFLHFSVRTVGEAALAENFLEKYFTTADILNAGSDRGGCGVLDTFWQSRLLYPSFVITIERGYVVTPNIRATMKFIIASDDTVTLPYIILFVCVFIYIYI